MRPHYPEDHSSIERTSIRAFESYFDIIDNEEKAYWLGFIVADGCVLWNERTGNYALQIGLQSGDSEHLEQLARDMGSLNLVARDQRNGTCRLVWYSKRLVARLIELGIMPRKSGVEKIPTFPLTLEKHFWRGVFDGDGMLKTQSKGYNLVTEYCLSFIGSLEILSGFQQWAQVTTGVRTQKISRAKNSQGESAAFVFYMNGNRQIAALTDALYRGSTRRLHRKYEAYCALVEQNARVRPSYRRIYLHP